MSQSRLSSLTEALINTAIGFIITMTVLPFVNLMCGIHMSVGQASLSTLIFTIVSIVRGYVIRRFFENNIARQILNKFK